MYHLRRNPLFAVTAEVVREKKEWARQRLADSSRGLSFEPEQHRYFLAGRELLSVSSVVERFAPFDGEAMAKRCSLNPKHPLYGKSVGEILAIWTQKRDSAAAAGTLVHSFAEACCRFMEGRDDLVEEAFRDRLTADGLAAVTPKEEAVARWWAEADWGRYAVVATETRIVNPVLQYAGTFDLLLYDAASDSFSLRDYKTNEDLMKWYGEMMRPPLNMLRSSDIGKYTVQQTLYSIQLRNIGLRVDDNVLVWLKEDGYEKVPLETRYDKVISYAVKQLINN